MLAVADLAIGPAGGGAPIVREVSLSVPNNGVHVVIGETGSGKSLIAAAIMGVLPPELESRGSIALAGNEIARLPARARAALWARQVFLVPQEPWAALSPLLRVRDHVIEMLRHHRGRGDDIAGLLAPLGLDPAVDAAKFPWQMSGGMNQRVAFALSLAAPAPLILVDEPTKGLDAGARDRVTAGLLALQAAGKGLLVITHDLDLARALGGTLTVLRDGAVVEQAATAAVLERPRHAFSRALVAALPRNWPRRQRAAAARSVVELAGIGCAVREQRRRRVLVDGFDVAVGAGEIVGLAGPSGSGKTTLGNIALRLRAPEAGTVAWIDDPPRARAGRAARRRYQKLYQDPVAAFVPWRTLRASLADAFDGDGARAWPFVEALFARLQLATALLDRRPHQVSGGELQRAALVRALLCRPRFIFADEPSSRLDPIAQHGLMGLLAATAEEERIGILLVSHDRALLDAMCDRVRPLETAPDRGLGFTNRSNFGEP
jgi:peptide/nickel transport system ATP-binding protein